MVGVEDYYDGREYRGAKIMLLIQAARRYQEKQSDSNAFLLMHTF